MLLHPDVPHHGLVNVNELAQRILGYTLDGTQPLSAVLDRDQLLEAFESKLQEGRDKALVLLPLCSGLELPWTGQDLFSTSSASAIASLLDPDAGGPDAIRDVHIDYSARHPAVLDSALAPPESSLRLVCPLGVPLSPIYYRELNSDTLADISQSQVWQVEVIRNGIVHTPKLVLKLYEDRVRTPRHSFAEFGFGRSVASELHCDGRTLACNEAAAYKKLAHPQGSLIPLSYGTYEFELPDGQGSCLGMLTEYIEDVSLSAHVYRTLQAQGDDGFEVVKSLAKEYSLAVKTIADSKVIPRHVNVTSVKYEAASGKFTFIGFSSSEPELREIGDKCDSYAPFMEAIREMDYSDLTKEEDAINAILDIFEPDLEY